MVCLDAGGAQDRSLQVDSLSVDDETIAVVVDGRAAQHTGHSGAEAVSVKRPQWILVSKESGRSSSAQPPTTLTGAVLEFGEPGDSVDSVLRTKTDPSSAEQPHFLVAGTRPGPLSSLVLHSFSAVSFPAVSFPAVSPQAVSLPGVIDAPSTTVSRSTSPTTRSSGVVELDAPPGQRFHRSRPVLLARDAPSSGAFVGLAWLEGQSSLDNEVWFSAWTADGFSRPQQIAAHGPGSQVALRGTVLANGDVLLVWSAFDGVDHDIVYSIGSGGLWSTPARIAADNDVPDVTPTIVATDDGAIVVWSFYDGHDYRLRTSRFLGATWTRPRTFGGRGSVDPVLQSATETIDVTDSGALLSYRETDSASDVFMRWHGDGRSTSTARLPLDGSTVTWVLRTDDRAIALLRMGPVPSDPRQAERAASVSGPAAEAEAARFGRTTPVVLETLHWVTGPRLDEPAVDQRGAASSKRGGS